jgi:hypothetical protein
MLGHPVRCPACLQTILAPSPDELLPTVTLAPETESGAVPPPVARVLTRPPAAARDRPWSPADMSVVTDRGGMGTAVVIGLALGILGLVTLGTAFVWFLTERSSAPGMAATKSVAMPSTPLSPGWEVPEPAGAPGSEKLPSDSIGFGPYEVAGLTGPPEQVGAVTITPVVIPGMGASDHLIDSLCWSADASQIFILTTRRQLVRADVPGFGRGQQFDFSTDAHGLARSAKSLMVTLPSSGDVCLLDPTTMQVTRHVGITGVRLALTAPDLSVAYAFCWNDPTGVTAPAPPIEVGGPADVAGAVVRIDLDTGTLTPLTAPAGLFPLADLDRITLAPDGKSLTIPSGSAAGRYAIIDDSLRLEPAASTPPTAPGMPPARRSFAQADQGRLVVREADDKRVTTYDLGPARAGQRARYLVPHPSGNALFVALPQELLWVELPAQ